MDLWDQTKKYLGQFSNNGKEHINEAMTNDFSSVTYKQDGDKKFWEWYFLHNDFECFLQYQTGSKKDIYRIYGFNNEKSLCYFREPLSEDLNKL